VTTPPGDLTQAAVDAANTRLRAAYAAIPSTERVVLDWRTGHDRRMPGTCVRCRSPSPVYMVDDDGLYSHKLCAEIEAHALGVRPASTHPPRRTTHDQPVA
jgi:hypothetical protein